MTGETIGKRIRRLRVARGLSQRELAVPGVSYAYISRIEAGQRDPSVKALRKLAPKLGVSVEYLETGKPDPWERFVANVKNARECGYPLVCVECGEGMEDADFEDETMHESDCPNRGRDRDAEMAAMLAKRLGPS